MVRVVPMGWVLFFLFLSPSFVSVSFLFFFFLEEVGGRLSHMQLQNYVTVGLLVFTKIMYILHTFFYREGRLGLCGLAPRDYAT
jgi:hypothetical protein